MALSTVQTNNKAIRFTTQVWREYVKNNQFSAYMGMGSTSIIRTMYQLKDGGEQINVPLVERLKQAAIGAGTLVGNEEKIDDYGLRFWIDWARNAVTTKKSERQKDSADIFSEAQSLLTDWGKELQRDEVIASLMALPSESAPAGLGSDPGQRVNGILYEAATAAQNNTWAAANSDRILYGNAISNYSGTHATDLAKVDTTDDKFKRSSVSLMKRVAELARPNIRPFRTEDGYEAYVIFCGTTAFRDLKTDLESVNQNARPRSNSNIVFKEADLEWDNVLVRKVPQIDTFVDTLWDSGIDGNLKTGGNGGARVTPVFLCGQQAMAMPWGQAPIPTKLTETDYGFKQGVGIEMAYGLGKTFKKMASGGALKQWGVVTGFFASAADA
jgi:hypothetical protein